MGRINLFVGIGLLVLAPMATAGGKVQLQKQEKGFYVPRNESLIRVVRLKFHPTEPHYLLGQISDRKLAVWNLNAPIPDKAPKGLKEKYIAPALVCEHALGWIVGFDVHPKGTRIATGGSDRTLKVWAWQDGKPADKPAREVKAHDGWVEAVAWSPDGNQIATAGADKKVKVWSGEDLKLLETFSGHKGFVRGLAWAPDGTHLFSGGEDGKVIAWDVAQKKQAWAADFGNANDQSGQIPRFSGVMTVAVSSDGLLLAAIGQEKMLVYDAKTGHELAAEKGSFDVCFHPKQNLLLGGSDRASLWRYDPAKLLSGNASGKDKSKNLPNLGTALTQLTRQGEGVAISPDGQWLAATERESTVALWKIAGD